MPKGIHNINSKKIEHLRAKLAQSLAFPLNSNKNYDLLSNVIFERTGALLSNSTLRRVFQYNSENHPTKSTLDLICKAIGFRDWDDFIENESTHLQYDLSQLIAMFKLKGISDHENTWKILEKYSAYPDFFNLLDTVVEMAITIRDIDFLSKLFDLENAFKDRHDQVRLVYFIHKFVIGLNQSGLMTELISTYGASKNAQTHLVESYVDEDNLNGYYYDLIQEYHKHKTTPEALLFYHCLLYQRAIENNLETRPHLEFIRRFSETTAIHNLPKGRRLAILLLEDDDPDKTVPDILNQARDLFHNLSGIARIITALYMVRLLFIKRKDELIEKILLYAPEVNGTDWNIDDLTNINQIKIYRAYSLYTTGDKEKAQRKLTEFDPLMIHAFIYNHIMNDYRIIRDLITTE